MGNGLLAIEPTSKDTISEDAIRDQLSRILESSVSHAFAVTRLGYRGSYESWQQKNTPSRNVNSR